MVGRTAALQGPAQGHSATRRRRRPSDHGGVAAPRRRRWGIQGGKRSGRRRRARGSSPCSRFVRRWTGEGARRVRAELRRSSNGGRRRGRLIRPGDDEIGLEDGWRRWRARLLGSGRGESRHDGEDGRHGGRRWLSSSSAQPTRVRKEKGRKNGHGSGERDKDASARLRGERGSTSADAWRRERRARR